MTETDVNFTGSEIAVIGLSCKFPGAKNSNDYWEVLKNGVETLSFLNDDEMIDMGVESATLDNPKYVKANGGFLEEKWYFDASFFDFTPIEAEMMDPQMRIFHECVYSALENAAYNPHSYDGYIGLYSGAGGSGYWELKASLSGKCETLGDFATMHLINKDYLGTQVAYNLDLKGPCFMVQTACSTSLVAVHLACQGILNGECTMALAGGVRIISNERNGYLYQEGMILSPDGHCRTFDARAKGMVPGEGAGVVLLKSLEDAVDDRDFIYAVIKGTAINNDGLRKVGYTAPSIKGQAEVIRMAHQVAEISAETVSYIEAHGTGTTLGDPIEIEALKLAFNTQKRNFCSIGSVKSNIGHLDAAAGVSGLIKTILALHHRLIPPSLHFEVPNPKIDFENSPFVVNTRLKNWDSNPSFPRRAGVSAFGIGGTNAHIVLEEWINPNVDPGTVNKNQPNKGQYQLLLLSAKTPSALEQMTENLVHHFKANRDISLADAAYSLSVGRKEFPFRKVVMCNDITQAIDQLSTGSNHTDGLTTGHSGAGNIIFIFPGINSCYINMGLALYRYEPLFKEQLDRCVQVMQTMNIPGSEEIVYPNLEKPVNRELEEAVTAAQLTPMAVFCIEFALTQLLINWGIKPDAVIGFGYGEYAAACATNMMSLETALTLISNKGEIPVGKTGGHSIKKPDVPFMSGLTGKWETEGVPEGTPWRACIESGALPDDRLAEIIKKENATFITVGPENQLSRFLNSSSGEASLFRMIGLIPPQSRAGEDSHFLMEKLAQLWLWGAWKQPEKLYSQQVRYRIPLPSYPFEKHYYWIEEAAVKKRLNWKAGGGEGLQEKNLREQQSASLGEEKNKDETREPAPIFKARPELMVAYVPPASETEEQIALEWQRLLGFEKIGIEDDFFDLGGDSVLAIKLASQLSKCGYDISLDNVLSNTTIKKLAAIAEERGKMKEKEDDIYEQRVLSQLPCIEKLNNGHNERKFFLIHPNHGMVNQYKMLATFLEKKFNVYGVQARGVTPGTGMSEDPQQMINDYLEQIQAADPQGPYIIGGYCGGAIIGYELARRLEDLKKKVEVLVLFDSGAMFSDRYVKILKILNHLPGFFKSMVQFFNKRKFLKNQKSVREETFSANLSDDKVRRDLVERNVYLIANHILPMDIIKAPIFMAIAEDTHIKRGTEADFVKMTKSKPKVKPTPGDHNSIYREPNVKQLAELLMANI